MQVAVAFHRDGAQDHRFITRDLLFEASHARGVVRLDIPCLSLTDGTYTVSIMTPRRATTTESRRRSSINPEVTARARAAQ